MSYQEFDPAAFPSDTGYASYDDAYYYGPVGGADYSSADAAGNRFTTAVGDLARSPEAEHAAKRIGRAALIGTGVLRENRHGQLRPSVLGIAELTALGLATPFAPEATAPAIAATVAANMAKHAAREAAKAGARELVPAARELAHNYYPSPAQPANVAPPQPQHYSAPYPYSLN